MSGPQPEPPADPEAPFDPFRRRKEIEHLERRFREQVQKSSNAPVTTGEIERKVSEEMREFFSASEAHLKQVVPALESASHGSLQETTGEMRARIDDFFSEVNGDGARPGAPPKAPPAKDLRTRRAALAAETEAEAAPKPERGAARPGRAGSTSRPGKGRTGVAPRGAAASPAPGSARKSAVPETGDAAKPKLDLKTALERLRKHGGARGAPVVNFAAPAQPASAAPPEASPAASAPEATPAAADAAEAAPSAPARPDRSPDTGSHDTSSQDVPSTETSSPVASSPDTSSARGPTTGAASPGTAEAFAKTPTGPVPPATAQLQATKTAAERAAAEKALAEEAKSEEAKSEETVADPPPAPPAAAPKSPPEKRSAEKPPTEKSPAEKTPAEKTPVPRRAAEAALLANVPVAEPLPPAVVANVLAEQEIRWKKMDQTQSILPPLPREPRTGPIAGAPTLDRRKEPTTSGHDRSRRSGSDRSRGDLSTPPMADPGRSQLPPIGWGGSAPEAGRKPQTGGGPSTPTGGTASGAVRLGRPRSLSTVDDVQTPMAPRAPDRGESFDEIFEELQGLVLDTLKESVDETMHEAKKSEGELRPREARPVASRPSAPPAARTGAAAPAKPLRLAKPADDDEDEDDSESREESPAEPYQWGVQPAPRPAGAWLVGDEAPAAASGTPANPAKPAPAAESAEPAAAPAPAPAKDPREISAGAGLGVGGRAYLVKKAADEVKRIQPMVDSLVRKGVVKPEEFADPAAPAPRKGSDDDLSVDSFADRPRVDLEKELSPVRLVEELRRIRRLTDALLAKGVVTQEDLNRIAE